MRMFQMYLQNTIMIEGSKIVSFFHGFGVTGGQGVRL